MSIKVKKFKLKQFDGYDENDIEDRRPSKTENLDHRRPVKNWKKAWSNHVEDYDEYDEFYGKKMSIR